MSLFEEFQLFRILCVCPCCGDLVRMSDLRLKAKGPATKTWLDEHETKEQKLANQEEAFEEEEEKLGISARKGEKGSRKSIPRCNMPLAQDPKS